MSAVQGLQVHDEPPLRTCLLDVAHRRNALSARLCEELTNAIVDVSDGISLVAVGNTGDTFSAGADLAELAPALLRSDPPPSSAATLVAIRKLLSIIESASVPVVAAVDGTCLAGGLELALACDCIAATRRSRFFDGHLSGLLPPSGGAAIRLPERVGRGRAFRFIVEGAQLDAQEAFEWHLIDLVVADRGQLEEWARGLALRLAGLPTGLVMRLRAQLAGGREARSSRRFEAELADLDSYLSEEHARVAAALARYLK